VNPEWRAHHVSARAASRRQSCSGAAVSKTVVPRKRYRGFESPLSAHLQECLDLKPGPRGLVCVSSEAVCPPSANAGQPFSHSAIQPHSRPRRTHDELKAWDKQSPLVSLVDPVQVAGFSRPLNEFGGNSVADSPPGTRQRAETGERAPDNRASLTLWACPRARSRGCSLPKTTH
jgi:hypothetical protein